MKLFKYQEEGVEKIKNLKRSLLADVPGLGKTAQAITATKYWLAEEEKIAYPNKGFVDYVIIVCPAILKSVWEDELIKWQALDNNLSSFVIFSYNKVGAFNEQDFKQIQISRYFLIADEFHYCKNLKAKRTKAVVKLISKAERFIGITGTPITKSVADLYPLVKSVSPESFPETFHKFCRTYSYPKITQWGVDYVGIKSASELKERLFPFMVRRLKKEVLTELPEKIEKNVYLKLGYDEKEEIKEIIRKKTNEESLTEDEEIALATLRKELGSFKKANVVDYCKELIGSGDFPLVIFAYHRDMVLGLSEELDCPKIIGGDKEEDRAKVIKEFQEGKHKAIILSIKAAQVGITLTRSSTCIFAELDWNPADVSQAIDRLHRIGQKNCVIAHKLIVKNSLDEAMLQILKNKNETINEVME